jgi:AraC family transcriptional regulator, transcriptional activator of pobA
MKPPRKSVPNYRLYGESFDAAPDFWVHCETLPVRTHLHNFEIGAHRHDGFFQIFLITAGGGEMSGVAGPLHFSAPCVLFIPPGTVHGFQYERDSDGIVVTSLADRLASIAAADRQIADFASTLRVVPMDGTPPARMALQALETIERELAQPAAGRAALLEALMTTAIVGLVRSAGAEAPERSLEDRDVQRVEQLLGLIGTHFQEHRPVGFYASRIGVSPTHLNRLARAQTGLSVQGLVARRLLEAARRDLIFSPSPVQKIAYSLGFSDPAYFNRFFRRMTGTTPGAFRTEERHRLAV